MYAHRPWYKLVAHLSFVSTLDSCTTSGPAALGGLQHLMHTVWPKIFEVENFHGFRRSECSREIIVHEMFSALCYAVYSKFNHENFIPEN